MRIVINPEYNIGDIVYNKTDMENFPCIVVGYEVLPGEIIKYKVNNDNYANTFFDFELSLDKNVF